MAKFICVQIISKIKKPPDLGGLIKLYLFTYLYNTPPLLLNCNNADNSDTIVV
ncbi:MAG: hypothetical protein ABI441_00405 [Flavobacterium sp.]